MSEYQESKRADWQSAISDRGMRPGQRKHVTEARSQPTGTLDILKLWGNKWELNIG